MNDINKNSLSNYPLDKFDTINPLLLSAILASANFNSLTLSQLHDIKEKVSSAIQEKKLNSPTK